jgi:hypothetical protein
MTERDIEVRLVAKGCGVPAIFGIEVTDDFTGKDYIRVSKYLLSAFGVKLTKTAYEIRGFFVKST